VLGLDLQLFFTGFAHPVVFTVNESMIVDAVPIIFRTELTFHNGDSESASKRRGLTPLSFPWKSFLGFLDQGSEM
jgi:hypothetical protein